MRLLKDGHIVLEEPESEAPARTKFLNARGASLMNDVGEAVPMDPLPLAVSKTHVHSRGRLVTKTVAAEDDSGHLEPAMLELPVNASSLELWSSQQSGSLELMLEPGRDPNTPNQNIKKKPEKWSVRLWKMYNKVYETLAPLRGGVGNIAATFAGLALSPENCILKIAYTLYSFEDEDDYPYMPLGCGGFIYIINGAIRWSTSLVTRLLLLAGLVMVLDPTPSR